MKGKEWVEAAVMFYEYWFSVSEKVREKLVEKVKEFETFSKSCGGLSKERAREYKRIIVSKVKAQCQSSDDFLSMLFGDLFSAVFNPSYYQTPEPVETEVAVKELLKQDFSQAQIIEIVARGEGCDSEKVAKILTKLSSAQKETEKSHHCSGHCGHCSAHEEHPKSAETLGLFEQVAEASQEDQEEILIALLKKKGLPLPTIAVVTGLSEEEIKTSKGYSI